MKKSFLIVFLLVTICLLIHGCSRETYFIGRGNRTCEGGNCENAIQFYNYALKINPHNKITYYNRGLAFFRIGEIDKAIADYSKAVDIDKDFIEAYCNRGLAWQKKGNHGRAITDYTKAMQLNPEKSLRARILFDRAYALYENGNYEPAITDFTESIIINPNNVEAWHFRAESKYKNGNLDAAIADYTKAIQINSHYFPSIFHRANTWHEKRDYVSAINDYEEAIKLDSQNALVYNNYSWLLSTCPDGKYRNGTKALSLAQKAVALVSGEAFYFDTLAAAYAELGNFDEAVRMQVKAISILKDDDLKEIFVAPLESYKSHRPWRENVKSEDWMRSYKIEK